MTLYVTNLPDQMTPADLAILFARFGPVAGADIWVGPDGDLRPRPRPRPRIGVIELVAARGQEPPRLDGLVCRERRLTVSLTRPHGKPPGIR